MMLRCVECGEAVGLGRDKYIMQQGV